MSGPFGRVCVYAGSAAGADPAYEAAAQRLAAALVERGAGIVYGGGQVGLMGAIADGVLAAGGEVVGVMPQFLIEREIGHPDITELLVVGTMHERKMLMADLADAFVVLPGGVGTLEEVVEMLSWSQLGLHRKPIGLLDAAGFWQPFVEVLDHMTAEGFVSADHRRFLLAAPDAGELLEAMAAWEAPAVTRWMTSGEET